MRVVLSTYGSRGDLELFVALAARLTARGVEVRVCAPPDEAFVARLDAVGVALMPVWRSARALTTEKPEPASLPQRAAELIADQFEAVTAAAQGCDLLVATGMLPATAGALSVAENLGLPTVSVSFQQLTVPSPHHRPLEYPGRPFPPDVTDYRALWDLDTAATDALFRDALNINRASAGLPAVSHVRDYVVGDRPWVASDPVLDPLLERPDLDVLHPGAWLLTGRPATVHRGVRLPRRRSATDLRRLRQHAAARFGGRCPRRGPSGSIRAPPCRAPVGVVGQG